MTSRQAFGHECSGKTFQLKWDLIIFWGRLYMYLGFVLLIDATLSSICPQAPVACFCPLFTDLSFIRSICVSRDKLYSGMEFRITFIPFSCCCSNDISLIIHYSPVSMNSCFRLLKKDGKHWRSADWVGK